MLTENQIFALRQLQSKDVANPTFYRVLTKTNCYGLSLGTPFIVSAANFQEVSKLNQLDYDPAMVIMNPHPVGKEYKPNTLAEVSYASLSVSSEPTFLDVHFIKESDRVVKDFNDAFNHALAGGAATVFFRDPTVAKEVLTQILPDIFNKYAYSGTFRSGFMSPTEKTVLMIQFFHPKHCCAIYYPSKVDGVLISVSAVMLETSIANDQIERPIYINLFVSNFLDNILTLDGSKIATADSVGGSYSKMIDVCISSMIQPSKQAKKSPQIVFKKAGAVPPAPPKLPNEVPVVAKAQTSTKQPSTILGSVLESRMKEAIKMGLEEVDVTSTRFTTATAKSALWTYDELLNGTAATQAAPPPPMQPFVEEHLQTIMKPFVPESDDGDVNAKDIYPKNIMKPFVPESDDGDLSAKGIYPIVGMKEKPKAQEYKAGHGTASTSYYLDGREVDTSTSSATDMAAKYVGIPVNQESAMLSNMECSVDCSDKPITKQVLRTKAKTARLREGYGGGSLKKTNAVSTRDDDFWT